MELLFCILRVNCTSIGVYRNFNGLFRQLSWDQNIVSPGQLFMVI